MAKKILAVDDESDVLIIVKAALETEGFVVTTAANGPDGVEAALADPPDLAIVDIMMPGMTGFDVVQELKKHDSTATIPIIMLTGLSDKDKIQKALTSGVDYYIVKPFEFEDLISKVNQALDGEPF